MTIQEKLLGEVQPTVASSAVVLYTAGSVVATIIKSIWVCNVSTSSTTFGILYNQNDSANQSTQWILKNVPIKVNETIEIDSFLAIDTAGHEIQVSAGVASGINFHAFGAEVTA